MSRGWVGVKACPLGVGGAVSSFGAAERSTMTPSIGFTCLTNGSPAAIVAGSRAPLVDTNGGRRRSCVSVPACANFARESVGPMTESAADRLDGAKRVVVRVQPETLEHPPEQT